MRAPIFIGIAAGLVVVGGCSSSSSQGGEPTLPAGGNVITRAEIEAVTNARSAYDVIRQLRYTWLQTRVRSPSGGDPVRVYVDGINQSGVEELRRIEPSLVAEMVFLDPGDATTRFGTGHTAGAILVFIIAIGYYITPALVGGQSGTLISNLIAYHLEASLNWGLAAALGAILLGGVLVLYLLYDKVVGIDNMKLG